MCTCYAAVFAGVSLGNLSAFNYNYPQNSVSTLSFFNSSTTFSQWKVELYNSGGIVQQVGAYRYFTCS